MKIEIRYRPPFRRWQSRLADALHGTGHEICFRAAAPRSTHPFGTERALRLEGRLFGPRQSLFDSMPVSVMHRQAAVADLVIALDGRAPPAARVLEPLFDGQAGATAFLDALARSASPSVAIRMLDDGREQVVVRALFSNEHPHTFSRAVDQALARLVSLILQAVLRIERSQALDPAEVSAPAAARYSGPRRRMARDLAGRLTARVSGRARGPSHWKIGFRQTNRAVGGKLTILPDNGRRFYADPMPFVHAGRSYIFFEDFPYRSAKGVIGVVEIDGDRVVSPPRTVLEQPFHVSYPFVLSHGGKIYMLPEMGAAGRIQLFRADRFPDRWMPDRVLVENVTAADATPVCYRGRWWLFATLSDDGGSSWDQLGLFSAPDLFGPWTPHGDNPVLVDAGAARPAGAMWEEGGVLMRVAQDCRTGYGAGLAICRVDRLDQEAFVQTVVARIDAPDGHGADGIHTLNRSGGLEVVDLRFPPLPRSVADRRPATPPATARD